MTEFLYKGITRMGGCLRKGIQSRQQYPPRIQRRDSLDLMRSRLETFHENSDPTSVDDFDHISLRTPSWISFKSDFGNDKDVYIEDEAICPICANNFNDYNFLPRILPCGHTFCNECVFKLAKPRMYRYLKCPLDRKIHKTNQQNNHDDIMSIASVYSSNVSEVLSDVTERHAPPERHVEDIRVIPVTSTSNISEFGSTRNYSLQTQQQGSDSSLNLTSEDLYSYFEGDDDRSICPPPDFVRTIWGSGEAIRSPSSDESESKTTNSTPSPDYSSNESLHCEVY